MGKIEVPGIKVNGPEDVPGAIEKVRAAAVELAERDQLNGERLQKIADELKGIDEKAEAGARAAKVAAEAIEIAKAAHENARSSEDKVERQLKGLPMVRSADSDEDWRGGKIPDAQFNVLQVSDDELRLYVGEDSEAYRAVKRFRRLNDSIMTADTIMRAQDASRVMQYERQGGMKGLKLYKAYDEARKVMQRSLDTATSGGLSEWLPVMYSTDIKMDAELRRGVTSFFPSFQQPSKVWTLPYGTHGSSVKVVGESTTTAGTGFTDTDIPVSGNVSVTAYKQGLMVTWSREADQDLIATAIPQFQQEALYLHELAEEDWIINGQNTATIDTGDDPAADDPRDFVNGLRYWANQVGNLVDFGGNVAVESLAQMIGAAKQYADPNQCAFITGYTGMAKALILKDAAGNVLYLTRERAGDAATLFTGQVGVLFGYPLLISGKYPQNMNASGIIDGTTTTKTGMLLVNRSFFARTERQGMQVEASDHVYFKQDLRAIRTSKRLGWVARMPASSSKPFVVGGKNITTY